MDRYFMGRHEKHMHKEGGGIQGIMPLFSTEIDRWLYGRLMRA